MNDFKLKARITISPEDYKKPSLWRRFLVFIGRRSYADVLQWNWCKREAKVIRRSVDSMNKTVSERYKQEVNPEYYKKVFL